MVFGPEPFADMSHAPPVARSMAHARVGRRRHARALAAAAIAVAIPVAAPRAQAPGAPTLTESRVGLPVAPAPPPVLGPRDAWLAGAFALGTVAAMPFDRGIALGAQSAEVQGSRALRRTAVFFRRASQPGAYLALGGLWAAGRLGGNERMAEVGLRGVEAVTVALVATGGVKLLAGRARPYVDKDRPHDFAFGRGFGRSTWQSFPSGHTTVGFAAAAAVTSTVAAHTPGARWPLGVALYGSGALMGLARIHEDRHWASDVVAGAGIGTVAGLAVARWHRARPGSRVDRWLLTASIRPAGGGGRDLRVTILPAR